MEALLLDKITSNLDGKAEERIVSALSRLGRKKSVLLVTHWVLPPRAVKEALVLEAGQVQAADPHDKLL